MKPIGNRAHDLHASDEAVALNTVETGAIDLAVRVAEFLGLPRSVGELYGLLFIAPEPMNAETLIARLQISRGSASQGLGVLKRLGAVRSLYVPGDRREHYVPENNLSHLINGFLQERVGPGLSDLAQRLDRLAEAVDGMGDEHYRERLAKVRSWREKVETQLPLLLQLLSK